MTICICSTSSILGCFLTWSCHPCFLCITIVKFSIFFCFFHLVCLLWIYSILCIPGFLLYFDPFLTLIFCCYTSCAFLSPLSLGILKEVTFCPSSKCSCGSLLLMFYQSINSFDWFSLMSTAAFRVHVVSFIFTLRLFRFFWKYKLMLNFLVIETCGLVYK